MVFKQRFSLLLASAMVLAACSSAPQVTRIHNIAANSDAPYGNILVITLLKDFDNRRYLEKEVVKNLQALGANATASTSMMNTKTPMTREVYIEMAKRIGADAVLVTQLASFSTDAKVVDMRPQTTVNFRPTYYYDVFSVEVTEYLEPQSVEFKHSLVLITDLYSARDRKSVWAIESKANINLGPDTTRDYSIFLAEAAAITRNLAADRLIN